MSVEHLSSIGDEDAFVMQWGKEKMEGGTVLSFRWGFSDSKVWKDEGKKEHENVLLHTISVIIRLYISNRRQN